MQVRAKSSQDNDKGNCYGNDDNSFFFKELVCYILYIGVDCLAVVCTVKVR